LRAWEKRYQVVTPHRDERGRLYTEADLHRLRLLNAAVEKGHAIGRLATLSNEELQNLIISSTAPTSFAHLAGSGLTEEASTGEHIAPPSVMAAIERLDYAEGERELSLLAAVLPPRDLIHRVALPLMRKVGEDWHNGRLSIAQEHMTSSLLRNLLGALIPLYRRVSPAAKVLFATPAGEQHEFGVLVSAMLAAGGGLGILYLGADLPADEIVIAAQKSAPQAVVLGFVGANGARKGLKEIQKVARNLSGQMELWVGGTQKTELVAELRKTRAVLIEDFRMLEEHLLRLGAQF
jgi:DNA-binding transcriptional MerR regulator/methylmalonyl-CoA mutase cobalamin-binding subunit